MSAIKILALVKYAPKGASSRVRFWNLRAGLAERGYNITVRPLLENDVLARYYETRRHNYWAFGAAYLRRIEAILSAETDTLFWIEKELLFGLPLGVESLFGANVRRCVFDYDDAVFLNYKDHSFGNIGRASKFRYYARNAAHITVGSDYLLKHMQAYGTKNICKIPSTVFVENYQKREHLPRSTTTIGWIGTPVTIQLLDTLRSVFLELSKTNSIKICIIGAQWRCAGLDVQCLPWTLDTEAELVSTFDIGVMPLIDGPWERGKCAYKLIQYMAAGVVPVGSNIGENRFVVQSGVNGFLPNSPAEWLRILKALCDDHNLRAEIGERARRKALQRYDVSQAVDMVDNVFRSAVRARISGGI